ncbi:MAG: penicillin amidase [Solirubrobacteraceae bacterium]|nr:penicillin amidase [Solirubrobacteraceae bacterium]
MRRAALLALSAALCGPAASQAKILRAETVLPPGQSGFVSIAGIASGTGSPHLYDQSPLFSSFQWKPALFGQPGTVETPKPGLTITRDAFGVPRVDAPTEADMWWGAGYAVAEDRLFELELFRHATTGTLSEIVGSSRLDDDRLVRQDFYTPAELDQQYAKVPASLKPRFEAYTAGVNAWISHVQTSPADLPAEYPATGTTLTPWTIHDTVAIGVYLARTIATNADPEGLELANLQIAQLGGARALNGLVPLRTPGQLTTIPRRNGLFPSQPGRSRAQERAGLRRSLKLAKTLPVPTAAGTTAIATPTAPPTTRGLADFVPKFGGSSMYALRGKNGHGYLFNGPQLGFDAPEKLLELELHAPGIDLRGMTAPGVPIIGAGFNDHVAWGVTTGASDADDLYAEQLVPGHPEQYMFKGKVRTMDCRDETLNYDSPPSDLLSMKPPESGTKTVRVCRTVHGPVEERAGNVAYARRYAIWGRELETVVGLSGLESAKNVGDVDRSVRKLTWNENVMAADDHGHIGFWHPGLMPLRPRGYDERLPYPGTGQAEWRGLLDRKRMPHVIDPKQGWLANWNNVPSAGWTSGDGTARKRLDGRYFRVGWLFRLVRQLAAKGPSFAGMQALDKREGTTAQQFAAAKTKVVKAGRGASGHAKVVLATLAAWDGSYARTDQAGTVDPGVATWDAFRAELAKLVTKHYGKASAFATGEDVLTPLYGNYHHGSPYHYFDALHLESTGLRTLSARAFRTAAAAAFTTLAKRFGTDDATKWREPRRMYPVGAVGATAPDPIPFFDRGTYEQFVELG